MYTTSKVAEPQTYKTPLVGDIRVFTGQRKVVFQDRYRLREAYAMSAYVRFCLCRIPFEPHRGSV